MWFETLWLTVLPLRLSFELDFLIVFFLLRIDELVTDSRWKSPVCMIVCFYCLEACFFLSKLRSSSLAAASLAFTLSVGDIG